MANKLRPNQMNYYDTLPTSFLTNGGFEIWQRGNGPFTSMQLATADEWFLGRGGVVETASVVRTAGPSVGSGDPITSPYALRVVAVMNGGLAVGIRQGIERYTEYEGQWLTFSVWVKTSVANAVRCYIEDYTGTGAIVLSDYHPGDGQWHKLTAVKEVRSGLAPATGNLPHASGLAVGVSTILDATFDMDGSSLVVGKYPYGVEFVPLDPTDDLTRCQRYYWKTRYGETTYPMRHDSGGTKFEFTRDLPTPYNHHPSRVITILNITASLFQDPADGTGVTLGDDANWSALAISGPDTTKINFLRNGVVANRSSVELGFNVVSELA